MENLQYHKFQQDKDINKKYYNVYGRIGDGGNGRFNFN